MLVNRSLRDAAFRTSVVEAYKETCAVTGLRIVNGGGSVEVQAAHIWSVADGGADIVQNGIALSATCHWLFDRHLISLGDDYGLLVSHNRVPSELRSLFENQIDRIHLPSDKRLWPRLDFIALHREKFAGDLDDERTSLRGCKHSAYSRRSPSNSRDGAGETRSVVVPGRKARLRDELLDEERFLGLPRIVWVGGPSR